MVSNVEEGFGRCGRRNHLANSWSTRADGNAENKDLAVYAPKGAQGTLPQARITVPGLLLVH